MSYQILGRTIKNEYLALSVMGSAIGGALLATRGGKKEPVSSGSSKSVIEKVKESVPIAAGSSEEEQFIKNFIAEAEKEASGSKH